MIRASQPLDTLGFDEIGDVIIAGKIAEGSAQAARPGPGLLTRLRRRRHIRRSLLAAEAIGYGYSPAAEARLRRILREEAERLYPA